MPTLTNKFWLNIIIAFAIAIIPSTITGIWFVSSGLGRLEAHYVASQDKITTIGEQQKEWRNLVKVKFVDYDDRLTSYNDKLDGWYLNQGDIMVKLLTHGHDANKSIAKPYNYKRR